MMSGPANRMMEPSLGSMEQRVRKTGPSRRMRKIRA
jgi:hypothetical protein